MVNGGELGLGFVIHDKNNIIFTGDEASPSYLRPEALYPLYNSLVITETMHSNINTGQYDFLINKIYHLTYKCLVVGNWREPTKSLELLTKIGENSRPFKCMHWVCMGLRGGLCQLLLVNLSIVRYNC